MCHSGYCNSKNFCAQPPQNTTNPVNPVNPDKPVNPVNPDKPVNPPTEEPLL